VTQLVGHAAAQAHILEIWRSGRVPHGWLISGPSGIGKALLAQQFATFALAGSVPEGLQIADDHPTARRMASGGHADFVKVERTENTTGTLREEIVVDDVRRIAPMFRRTAAEGGWRVALVDGADRMNPSAQNAILKILEEPPPQALIILTAEQPGRLLPTLRSRVHKLALQPLGTEEVVAILKRKLPTLEPDDFLMLAQLSEGSPGRAIELQQTEGYQACREFIALAEGAEAHNVLEFAERHGRKGAEGSYNILARYIPEWLESVAKTAAGLGGDDVAYRLATRWGLARTLALYDRTKALLAEANGLYLDHKQVLLTILFMLHDPEKALA